MKKIVLLLILTLTLFASENYELKLYQSVLPILFGKESLYVYLQDREQRSLFKNSSHFKIVEKCSNADLIIGKNFDDLSPECIDKPLFATSYRSFRHTQNAFGAFYWAKGRPQIQFKAMIIKKYKLHLPQNLSKYAK